MRRRRGGQVIEMIAGIILEKPRTLTEPKAASGRRLAHPGAAVTPAARGIHAGCESTNLCKFT